MHQKRCLNAVHSNITSSLPPNSGRPGECGEGVACGCAAARAWGVKTWISLPGLRPAIGCRLQILGDAGNRSDGCACHRANDWDGDPHRSTDCGTRRSILDHVVLRRFLGQCSGLICGFRCDSLGLGGGDFRVFLIDLPVFIQIARQHGSFPQLLSRRFGGGSDSPGGRFTYAQCSVPRVLRFLGHCLPPRSSRRGE